MLGKMWVATKSFPATWNSREVVQKFKAAAVLLLDSSFPEAEVQGSNNFQSRESWTTVGDPFKRLGCKWFGSENLNSRRWAAMGKFWHNHGEVSFAGISWQQGEV
ncbi:hypothetical protein KFK09_024393 [Dendrobium nobile]|uniref:Uncharacterized protein n=1 Tax=Dendrobium nobile TaxID=94219 RepID=A0A8T3ADV6_DENNO|nr:hypothetical protein KFK09_024393 [Dendrobium nobile]